MTLYFVTNDFLETGRKGEEAAMTYIFTCKTYLEARRVIQSFANWDVKPVMHRKVVPLKVIKSLQTKNMQNNAVIATFTGTRKGEPIWFAISMTNIEIP